MSTRCMFEGVTNFSLSMQMRALSLVCLKLAKARFIEFSIRFVVKKNSYIKITRPFIKLQGFSSLSPILEACWSAGCLSSGTCKSTGVPTLIERVLGRAYLMVAKSLWSSQIILHIEKLVAILPVPVRISLPNGRISVSRRNVLRRG